MEKQKKRSFLTLVRSLLLIGVGCVLLIMAVNYPSRTDKILFSAIGIPTLCIGLYYAYVFIRGDKVNSDDMEDAVSRQLRLLNDLYALGILTEEEYSEKKSKLLDL